MQFTTERRLSPAGRKAIARAARRNARRNAAARKRKQNRMADAETLKNRARRAAVNQISNKLLQGKNKTRDELSRAEKEQLERTIAKKSALIDRLAKKLLPIVRTQEKERISKRNQE